MPTEGRRHIRWFRNTAPYINAHRGKTFVLMLGGEAAHDANFPNIIHDIALLNSLGIRLVILVGARPQIAQRLQAAGLTQHIHNGVRITDADSIVHVKDAVGAIRIQVEAMLSMGLPNSPMQGSRIQVASGNNIAAQPIGVVDGVAPQLTGRIRRVARKAISAQLDAGAIVLLSPLGYSPTGEVFNLSLDDIAVHTAAAIEADKLILFGEADGITGENGELLRQCSVGEAQGMALANEEQARLLATASRACLSGVSRCQIISYKDDCALLEELFTHDGSGTLIASDSYEQSRVASIDDIGGILELIEPLEQSGVLLKRSRELLEAEIRQFRILERDGRIIACAALYPFEEDNCGELACIVTDPEYRGGERGLRLLNELEREARRHGLDAVFVLTTQTAHWFIEQGFEESTRKALPGQRNALYNLQRNSKVLFKKLTV